MAPTTVAEYSPVEEAIVALLSMVVSRVAHEEVSPEEAVASEVVEAHLVAVVHHEVFKL